jgi:hypothetical protein
VGFGEMAALHFAKGKEGQDFISAPPDHTLFLKLADIAANNNVVIDLHMEAVPCVVSTDEGCGIPLPQELSSFPNPPFLYENISALERLLEHNRNARIVWDHAGWDNTGYRTVELMRSLLEKHSNLYMNIKIRGGTIAELPNLHRPLDDKYQLTPEWLDFISSFPSRFTIGVDLKYRDVSQEAIQLTRVFLDQLPSDLANRVGLINPIQVSVFSGYWADFDGDGTTDVAAFHLPSDQFFTDYAGNLGQFGWGGSDSMPLVWDYDGDGKTDVSIYHIPTNQWFVMGVGNLGQFGWGGDESIPVPGDYNGDGRMERAFYHSPSNRWFVEGQDPVQFGWNGAECIPVPGDYDGDGKTDMVIYHLPSNQWFQYGVGNLGQFGWGGEDCLPVPGDYNGDGKMEIAVYHVPTNQWFVKGIGNLGQYGWGGLESFPIPGDYNGDSMMERGFYRPSENRWFIEGKSNFVWGWGGSDFMPITSQIAVYNWFRFIYGAPNKKKIIEVSNASDEVNGDTTNIITLMRKPGPDGISFREAIKAANNTKGPKMIKFSPKIKGSTIKMGSAGIEEVIVLTSGNLIIDGDIDGDGKPDITLDGSIGVTGPLSVGISIWSSNNMIKGLSFNDFANVSIIIACPDVENISSAISGNQIINNNISSSRGTGIQVGIVGLLDPDYLPDLSDKTISETIINGNTISVGSGMTGIYVAAAVGGSSRNKITSLTIEENQISGGLFGISVLASDAASDYFGIYNPIYYSDNNLVENITISDNVVKDFEWGGIDFGAANFGNRDNRILNTKVVNNTVSSNGWTGISMTVAGDSGERSTSNNLIDNIELRQNSITGGKWGIQLRIGNENRLYAGVSYNQLTNVLIENNNIKETQDSGIIVLGGSTMITDSVGSFSNSLESLTISQNEINSLITGNRIGITILGGWAIAGPARENKLEQISLLNNNMINTAIGIWIIGGRGIGAEGNDVIVSTIKDNTVDNNSELVRLTDNYEGGIDNEVIIIGQQKGYSGSPLNQYHIYPHYNP